MPRTSRDCRGHSKGSHQSRHTAGGWQYSPGVNSVTVGLKPISVPKRLSDRARDEFLTGPATPRSSRTAAAAWRAGGEQETPFGRVLEALSASHLESEPAGKGRYSSARTTPVVVTSSPAYSDVPVVPEFVMAGAGGGDDAAASDAAVTEERARRVKKSAPLLSVSVQPTRAPSAPDRGRALARGCRFRRLRSSLAPPAEPTRSTAPGRTAAAEPGVVGHERTLPAVAAIAMCRGVGTGSTAMPPAPCASAQIVLDAG